MKKILTLLFLAFACRAVMAAPYEASPTQKLNAETVFRDFLNYVAEGSFEKAYRLQTSSHQKLISLKDWQQREKDFMRRSGGNGQMGNIRALWQIDPAGAESPGIYVVFEYACRYQKFDSCSGRLVLHSFKGDDFQVLRHERFTAENR